MPLFMPATPFLHFYAPHEQEYDFDYSSPLLSAARYFANCLMRYAKKHYARGCRAPDAGARHTYAAVYFHILLRFADAPLLIYADVFAAISLYARQMPRL